MNIRAGTLWVIGAMAMAAPGWFMMQEPAPETGRTRDALQAVAGAVTRDSGFGFVEVKSGRRVANPASALPGERLRPENPYTDWRYWNGVLVVGLMRLGETLNEPRYTRFAREDIAFNFDSYRYFQERHTTESKWEYPFAQHFMMEELDDCGAMGAGVIEVYRQDPQERYRAYLDKATEFVLTKQHRLDDRTLVRTFPRKWTLWVDDLYMSVSLLARMGELSGDARCLDDAALQVINFHAYLFDEAKGLMHHCWYSDTRQGGVAYWGRGNGWALVAQVDLLDRLPASHPKRATLLALLKRHIQGIARYQSGDGLWHQLVDRNDSFLETSCTAMFTYAMARAVNRGYIEPRYASQARRGWEGVLSRIGPAGEIQGVCAGTGVSDSLNSYYTRPTPLNDPHGTGAILLAGTEILQMRGEAK